MVEEEAIKAQEQYLYQFLNHVNQYTGIAYKDDPDIVAFEISNEPHHRGTPEQVTQFINRMAASMRKTGSKKPIFYNVTHSVHLDEAYFNADIQGGTFQWYPTGLGAKHELRGNFLPNVDKYTIPFADNPTFRKAAKVVYEFDAADVGRSYIYPAMARSFREAGIQWATHCLEVLPDALWVGNLFGTNSLKKEVAVVNWRSWPMQVQLPDLGQQFKVSVLNSKQPAPVAKGGSFEVSPGVYLLVREGVTPRVKAGDRWKNIRLDEFAAPATTLKKHYVLHKPFEQVSAGKPLKIKATVVTAAQPEQVALHVSSPAGNKTIAMERVRGYEYRASIPAEILEPGYINYTISLTSGGKTRSFPAEKEGTPRDWDFYDATSYGTAVVPQTNSLYLFQAFTDAEEVSKEWRKGSHLIPGDQPGTASLQIPVEQLFVCDAENLNGPKIHDFALRYNFRDKIAGRAQEVSTFKKLVLRGNSKNKSFPVQLALIDSAGNTYGGTLTLDPNKQEYTLDLAELRPVKQVVLPRPYPTFLPYFFEPSTVKPLDLSSIETLQISIGADVPDPEAPYAFEIESVRLE